jgi:putative ABC transport system substrate-binding protein
LDRRTFLGTLTGGLLAAPLAVEAQQPGKVWRVAYLSLGPGELHTPRMKALTQQLRELGYVEGKNLILDYQSAEGQPARLADLAAALVVTKPDAIIAGGGTLTARAAKKATDSIPIVMVAVGDPVAAGLVASLARPGGNVTGLSTLAPEVAEKRIQLLAELLPRLSHVAVLLNPVTPYSERALAEIKTTATSLGVQVHVVEMRSASDLAAALKQAMRFGPALMVLEDPLTYALREKIAELAIANQLTAIYGFREHVEVGGLMSYGADLTALYRRAASYLDKILKGVRPADLPVEQPTTFELVINLKTAKSLGLTIPPSLLQRADQVIE